MFWIRENVRMNLEKRKKNDLETDRYVSFLSQTLGDTGTDHQVIDYNHSENEEPNKCNQVVLGATNHSTVI